MKAAILAAGAAEFPADGPRTLVPVAGVPILRRAITSLLHVGFDQFVIGTGHHEDEIRAAVATWFPTIDITCVTNPAFATTHNAATLLLLRPHLEDGAFLLLDGDVVFDVAVAEVLVERGPDCLAVRSVGTLGLEEVKVTVDNEDRVLAIGKHVPVRSAMGESVGLTLVGAAASRRLFAALESRAGTATEYYEAALQQLVDEGVTLYGADIGSLYASEIDTIEDLRAADARLERGPAFDLRVEGMPLAI